MEAEILRDELAHVDAGGFGAEDTDLEILSVHQSHRRRSQRDHNGTFVFSLSMSDSELAPRLVDGCVEES
jgi:histidinol phosphatase-like PHP family hydrolase